MAKKKQSRRMFGSIRKRQSGRYEASYWHEGVRHTAPQMFTSVADASTYLSGVETDVRRGGWIDPKAGQVTVKEYANDWLAGRHDLEVRTEDLYRWLLDLHILRALGSSTLSGLAPSKVRSWYSAKAKEHPVTAAKAYRLLSTIMKAAEDDKLILSSPCKLKGAGTEHSPERPLATVAEVEALVDAMPERLRLLVVVAAWCQLRRGELLGLRRKDVDLLHTTLSIEQARTIRTTGRSVVKAPKTAAGRRTVAVPPGVAMAALADHLSRFVAPEPDALVFTGEKGGPLSVGMLQKAWSKARRAIGRPDLHLHDLRHAGLTLAAAAGATTAELMHRAGHTSPAAALRYQHAAKDRDRVLADALADLITPAPVVPIGSTEAPPAE